MNEEMNIYKLLDQLDEEISGGKKVALTNKIVVDAGILTDCITDIRMNLPDVIKKASQIASERNKIIGQAKEDAGLGLAKAKEKCDQMLTEANEIASRTTAEAKNDASELIKSATEKSDELVSNARQEAERLINESEIVIKSKEYADSIREDTETKCREILESAKVKADGMVSEAQANAEDIMNQASAWATNLREKTTVYVDDLLRNTDDILVRNVNDIRKLRQSFQNMMND